MTGTSRMFDSINDNDSGVDSITFGNNKKGKVIGLGKIVISNDTMTMIVVLILSHLAITRKARLLVWARLQYQMT
jgi:hypothetical protein